MLAVEKLSKQHLVLGNGDVIKYQRNGPLHLVAESETLQADQIQPILHRIKFYTNASH